MKKENEAVKQVVETAEGEKQENKGIAKKKSVFSKKNSKGGKVKNQRLLKHGSYSLAITALILAVIFLFNWLISVLSDRFHLEFDMSSQKINSISEENIEYIKNIEEEIDIIVCAKESEYADYMNYYAQSYFNAQGEEDYYMQTPKLIKKYGDYNDNINIRYYDPQSSEFTAISQSYSNYNLSYGDIIVTCTKNGNKRIKHLTFEDIYYLTDESGYASAGYGYYTVSGSNLETALTSAMAYVSSTDSKKIAILTGHSTKDYTSQYVSLLQANNYEIETIADEMISEISSDYDAIVIMAPTIDFMGSEIDVIAEFLDNNSKLNKGLIYFADATCPALPNFYEFLTQWGIEMGEGIVFETDENNHVTDDPTTMGIYASEAETTLTNNVNYCIAGYNVPMSVCDAAEGSITATSVMETTDTVVVAPIGVDSTWNEYTEDDFSQFSSLIMSNKSKYIDNIEANSYVAAFSTVEYIQSQWASHAQLSNQDITLSCTDLAANVDDTGISFTIKTITNESFADAVTASSTTTIRIIFVILLPVTVILIGIFIYIRRKNAQ